MPHVFLKSSFNPEASSLPLMIFQELFSDTLISEIVTHTDFRLQIFEIKVKRTISKTNPGEILIVIGILMIIGLNKLPSMNDYWSHAPCMENSLIRDSMSRDRLLLLTSKLYLTNPRRLDGDQDLMFYIQLLVDLLRENFNSAWGSRRLTRVWSSLQVVYSSVL